MKNLRSSSKRWGIAVVILGLLQVGLCLWLQPKEGLPYLHTSPRGAQIWQYEVMSHQGGQLFRHHTRSWSPLQLTLDERRNYAFELRLAGYEPQRVTVTPEELRSGSFTAVLEPKVPLLAPLLYWARDHLFLLLAAGLILGYFVIEVRPQLQRHRRLQRLESLEELEEGLELAGYRLGRSLGDGGMAKVFEAYPVEEVGGPPVALKAYHRGQVDSTRTRELLRREVSVCRALSHRHIVHLLDWLEHPRFVFLVYELVRGDTLDKTAQAEPAQVAIWLRQTVQALEYCHLQGVLHRDIKPENLMLDEAGEIRILDFGIGLQLGRDGWQSAGTLETAGTIGYMAPEQLDGENSPAADYYALGVTAYRLLAGKQPFEGGDPLETLARQVGGAFLALSEARPGLDPRWDALVAGLLDPDAESRLKDPEQILARLQEL